MSLDRLGLQRTSTLDYPGRVAAVVFTSGCSLRCPYCHNPELARGHMPSSFVSRRDVMAFLQKRSAVLEGIVITGGEPLIHADLPALIREIADLGYTVKLDTTGLFPDMLQKVLAIPAVRCVAMDLKTMPECYHRVTASDRGSAIDTFSSNRTASLLRSISLLREWRDEGSNGVDRRLEFRTTCTPGVVTPEDLESIPLLLVAGDRWILNQFRPGNCLEPEYDTLTPYPPEILLGAAHRACTLGICADVRGI